MSRATPDDQLKFLLSCVRHSNNGKVGNTILFHQKYPDLQQIDFVDVAKECGVVSKGAAAKRYERLLKANGIHPSGGTTEKLPATPVKQRSKADVAKAASGKKRKIEGDTYNFKMDDDDEDDYICAKPEPLDLTRVKPEAGSDTSPYAHTPFDTPAQPPCLPTTPLPRVPTPFPFVPAYHHPSQPFRYPMPRPMYHPISRTTQIPGTVRPMLNHSQPTQTPQPKSSVTEEQIDAAFLEFCKQDMFKMPVFDQNLLPQQPTTQRSTPQISPRTIETAPQSSVESQQSMPDRPSEVVAKCTSAPSVKRPQNAEKMDYILIAD